ncbi:DNA gyrase subunit A [Patescibacteria group bacterium AH-259-L05]|nr:DNA gyrase subunit A [Patescibacteria group bacterium AH-259-L05]
MSKKKSQNKSPQTEKNTNELKEVIEPVGLENEVQLSYIDYAMSVIVSRALPDVRDGLKPVHRRILYAMHEMGLKHSAKYRKSATVVGSVIGRYHPHGDQAIYDSLVRMAQDFSLRYPLIDGQGNFGSVDGDRAAAYRYTEARLTPLAEEMLADIEQETVNFMPNYDTTTEEPQVLPAKLPNLLLNGSMGIAVGMATNIPPHNLIEVCDAIVHLIDHPKAEMDDLFEFIQGPDFPTGGIIFDFEAIKSAYALGKGGIVVRAKTDIVERAQNHYQIIVHELPYVINKTSLLTRIADLVRDKKLQDIKDIRDESGKEGTRIVFELKKGAIPQKILNQLFKLTELQQTFHMNMISLVDGIQPKALGLKPMLEEYIEHRKTVVLRRTEYNLRVTKQRIHILNGLKIAIDHIDAVIKLIKQSKDREAAKTNILKRYKLTEVQADAILDMRLHQLANADRNKVLEELKEKRKLARELKQILDQPKIVLQIIKHELKELKEKYGDERRTKAVKSGVEKFKEEDLISDEPAVIILTRDNYIKRLSPKSFKTQVRGGKGVAGLSIKEEDRVLHLITTTTHANLLFFTTKGRVFQLKAYDIEQATRIAKGKALVNFLEIAQNEKVSVILPVSDFKEYEYLVMVTKHGVTKKVPLEAFQNVRRSGLIALKLKSGDVLNWVKPVNKRDELVLVSAGGKAIRFKDKDLRPMGRVAAGVRGMRLKKDDVIVGMGVVPASAKARDTYKLLVITEHGHGKMSEIKHYRIQTRGGVGIKTANISDNVGKIVGAIVISEKSLPSYISGDLMLVSRLGQIIRLPLKSVPTMGRATQGVKLMRFKQKNDKVSSFNLI